MSDLYQNTIIIIINHYINHYYKSLTMRNVEIKAKIDDPDLKIFRVIQLTKQNSIVKVMKQHDTFFKVREGRLKLRKFQVRN